ncbi:hypothetical protein OG930_20200 [Streptomyces sp. NBC_01799]|nr:hypothetical protein [Streptomyces sp. NBC_01800]WSA69245.1 hypothetical protein OIE65_20915 [Streptomyces sp. NBC_01800]WSA77731.1 hypothetical protein OG930_20200 [Streptomyces sp. NBC_01799]
MRTGAGSVLGGGERQRWCGSEYRPGSFATEADRGTAPADCP